MNQDTTNQASGVEDVNESQKLQDKISELSHELEKAKQALASFKTKESEIKQKQDKLNALELKLEQQKLENERMKESLAQEKALNLVKEQALDKKESELSQLQEDLQNLKKNLEQQRLNLHFELDELRKKQEAELAKSHQKSISELHNLENKENTKIQKKIQDEYDNRLKQFNKEFAEKKEKLTQALRQVELDKQHYQNEKQRLDIQEERLAERENQIEQEIDSRLSSERSAYESRLQALDDSNERLRNLISQLEQEKNSFADLESCLNGQNPLEVLANIETQKTLIFNLQEELKSRPSKEVQDTLTLLQEEKNSLLDENQQLRTENEQVRELENQCATLEFEKETAERRVNEIKAELDYSYALNQKLHEEITLLSEPFGAEQNRNQRIESLLNPPQVQVNNTGVYNKGEISEQAWLGQIYENCLASDFIFPERILKAFHTSLKTGEFSPITVLAGVSGTGKSQLPALYSKFGGINFINVPVQPNWDSQEAMLGYFNSMTNHFDAQPVLRFLMQTQQSVSDNYPNGLKDMMNLILLDEMNLSHPELYFAEFLSKLEERRGKQKVPTININLGSGIQGYNLPLRRNVLWVGTMNQDETTKSLSDKVIDRSFIINFPRPIELKSLNLKEMSETIKSKEVSYLSYEVWHSWVQRESLFDEIEIKEYKSIIEQINNYMDKAGRALGHRVWQSIEYYMSNHPDVILAKSKNNEEDLKSSMRIAFEDQLVQKVMPKLRGIETRGRVSKNCLEPIQNLLDAENYSIINDFKHAREVGHGQFIWSSAYYLENDIASNDED